MSGTRFLRGEATVTDASGDLKSSPTWKKDFALCLVKLKEWKTSLAARAQVSHFYLLTIDISIEIVIISQCILVTVACGKEFTLIATKPYIGPTREELERRQEVQTEQAQSMKRQSKNVKQDQEQQLERIRRGKISAIAKSLNAAYPKCTICLIGTVCPGFQRDSINPAMCKHCMHERRKHDVLHKENDRRGTKTHLEYLREAIRKLGVTIDFSEVPDIDSEESLEAELDDYLNNTE